MLKKLFGGGYNKALVSITLGVIYFLNTQYGIEIPLSETEIVILFSVIGSMITYFVPNKEVK